MEEKKTQYFIVDAGNTRLKLGCFEEEQCTSVEFISYDDEQLWEKLSNCKGGKLIFSSVIANEFEHQLISFLSPDIVLSHQTSLPISLVPYETPHTLGMDRVANAVAGAYFAKEKPALIIDIGTCVKYDLVNEQKTYLGGIISPGMQMRFKAMHTFTGKLPLIEEVKPTSLIGGSTFNCMTSGVTNGLRLEIEGFINEFTTQFKNLTIFLTGGDVKYFDKGLKNTIFVNENLTLWGLYLILKHNAT